MNRFLVSLILIAFSALALGSAPDDCNSVLKRSLDSVTEIVLSDLRVDFEKYELKILSQKLDKGRKKSGEVLFQSPNQVYSFVKGEIGEREIGSKARDWITRELSDANRPRGPPLAIFQPEPGLVSDATTEVISTAGDTPMMDWKDYVERRLGGMEAFVKKHRPEFELSGLDANAAVIHAMKRGYTEVRRVSVLNITYGRDAFILTGPSLRPLILFAGFFGSSYFEHTYQQVRLLLLKTGVSTRVLKTLARVDGISNKASVREWGRNFARKLSSAHENQLIVGYRPQFEEELQGRGSIFESESLFGHFTIRTYRLGNRRYHLLESINSYYGDKLSSFIEGALEDGKLARVFFTGSVGSLDSKLPPYAVVRAKDFISFEGVSLPTASGSGSDRPGSSDRSIVDVIHGNSVSPLEQTKAFLSGLTGKRVQTLDVEASLVSSVCFSARVPFEFLGIITDYPGREGPSPISIDYQFDQEKAASKKIVIHEAMRFLGH